MKKMTKRQLILLVEKISNGEYSSEEEREILIDKFMANVPDPEAPNLIFYHKPRLTPEEIVEKALAYKPIVIPPYEDK